MRQHDSPPDEDDYGGDDGGEEPLTLLQVFHRFSEIPLTKCGQVKGSRNLEKASMDALAVFRSGIHTTF